jgi:hypothetical protein
MLIKEHTDWQFIISAKIGKFTPLTSNLIPSGALANPKEPITITDKKFMSVKF